MPTQKLLRSGGICYGPAESRLEEGGARRTEIFSVAVRNNIFTSKNITVAMVLNNRAFHSESEMLWYFNCNNK